VVPSWQVTVTRAVMTRTVTPPTTDRNDPSGKRRRTGGRRLALSRDQELRLRRADLGEEVPGAEAAVGEQHRGVRQVQQLPKTAPISTLVPVSTGAISIREG